MIVRAPTARDYPAIAAVLRSAFVDSRSDEAAIVAGVRAEGRVVVERVAVIGEDVIGHILFSRVACDTGALIVALGPLAVAPARRNQGVGDTLCRQGLDLCRTQGARGAVVLGHPTYYPRFGFSAGAARSLISPYAGRPAFMAMALVDGGLDDVRRVDYPAAFG